MSSTAHAASLPTEYAHMPLGAFRETDFLNETIIDRSPNRSFQVPGLARQIEVKIASERKEWEQAFELVAESYRARGYESSQSSRLRFTPFHALPDAVTFVAKHEGEVVATLSLVLDNYLLGVPMECVYSQEIEDLRCQGRRFGEATSLADKGLSLREFIPVFVSLIRILIQFTLRQGGDSWVISVNPKHRNYYRKVMGFEPLGPWREYPTVQNHPAEAYFLDLNLLKTKPGMYQQIMGEDLAPGLLEPTPIPVHLVRAFAGQSSHADSLIIKNLLDVVGRKNCLLRWR